MVTLKNDEIDSSLLNLILLDTIPKADRQSFNHASTQNNNDNRGRDYYPPSQTHVCENCTSLNIFNDDTVDDKNLRFLVEDKNDIIVGDIEKTIENKNKNGAYPYFPIAYYPP